MKALLVLIAVSFIAPPPPPAPDIFTPVLPEFEVGTPSVITSEMILDDELPEIFTSVPEVFTKATKIKDEPIFVTTQDNCYIDPITGRMVCPQNAPRLVNRFTASAANCPTCPQVQVQQPRVIRTYRQGHWTFPSYGTSSVYMHLMQDHRVDPTGLTEDQARELHDQLHEGVAGRTATFSMTSYGSGVTTANNPSGYFGSNGYQGKMFDGQGWYPGKGFRTLVDILTPGFGPRARARRMRRGR